MTVFILGAGTMQVPALRAARELGWKVAAADGNPAAPGGAECDRFFAVDLKDGEGLLAAARKTQAGLGLDAVFTAGTDFSAMVASLAESLGLPGHSREAALAASDKLLMRARFEAAGLPSPRFARALEATEASVEAILAGGLSLPLVVKPADNMGARGCRLARDPAALLEALAAALPFSRSGRAIVEEYIEGPEFSLDSLVYDGRLRLRGFADRHIAFAPYFVELGHTIPSIAPRELQERILAVFEAGVRALGLSHGAAKGDMKWCPSRGTPVIGEIAARLSGGYMSGWTWPYASGQDLTKDALLLAAGLRPEPEPSDRGWTSAERAYISVPGTLSTTLGLRAALASPYIKDLFVRAERGAKVVFPANNVEKCGNLIAQAPDHASAVAAAEGAIRGILVRLLAPDPATESFLRDEERMEGGGEAWPPRAFRLDAGLEALLETLPERLPGGAPLPEGGLIAVADLPAFLDLGERDWAGRSPRESVELALSLGGARLLDPSSPEAAGALQGRFWRALHRGGAQAALYVLDGERARGGGAL